jgi:RNA polymerase sigma-70 factor (ECF subfamily)
LKDSRGLPITRCSLEAEAPSGPLWSADAGVPPAAADATTDDERQLVELAQSGDVSAQGLLFDAHYVRIYRYLWSKVDRKEDAEDLAQEVFFRMLDALPRFQHRGVPFKSWLMQIAANLIKDHYRRRGVSGRITSLDDELEIAGDGDPAKTVELKLSMDEVTGAMQRHLTEIEREVIRLRYAAELSIAETAAVMGKSENNVKQVTFKALGKLRKALRRENAGS